MIQQVNLYTPPFREAPKLFSAAASGTALGLLALGLALLAAFSWWRVATLDRELGELQAQAAGRRKLIAATAQVIDGGERPAEAEARLQALTALLARLQQALKYLRDGAAGSHQGFADRMAALANEQIDGLWLRGVVFSSDSGHFLISGSALRAELVPIYLARLSAEEALAGTSLESIEIAQPRQPTRGEIEFTVSSAAMPAVRLAGADRPSAGTTAAGAAGRTAP